MIYRTIAGKRLELDSFERGERRLVQRAYRLYCLNIRYEEYSLRVYRDNNGTPSDDLSPATRNILADLKRRLGARQGRLQHDWDGPIDPAWNLGSVADA